MKPLSLEIAGVEWTVANFDGSVTGLLRQALASGAAGPPSLVPWAPQGSAWGWSLGEGLTLVWNDEGTGYHEGRRVYSFVLSYGWNEHCWIELITTDDKVLPASSRES